MATQLLQDRLKEIRRIRCKNPAIRDQTPTLVDIERTHILFMNAHFKPFAAIAYEYNRISPQEGQARFDSTISFSIQQFGDFFHDMMVHVVLKDLKAVVPGDQAQYCDYIGHKLFRKVGFEVNQNLLDSYDSNLYNFHYNCFVPEDKKLAWRRNVGQESPRPAILTQNKSGANGFPADNYREQKMILDGPQTPKAIHPSLELWIPLLFWFNVDPRLSIPSVAIPFGQRFITIDIASVDQLAFGVNNGGGGAITPPTLEVFELYTNNIFVNPEIHDIYIKRVGFTMIRVHKTQRVRLESARDDVLLDSLRWPTETLYWGAQEVANIDTPNKWHIFHNSVDTLVPYPVRIPKLVPPPILPAAPLTLIDQLAFSDAVYQVETPIFKTVGFRIQAIDIYMTTPVGFYNSYIPYTFGGGNIMSPEDLGIYITTFNLYPGSYQPSGHINLSKAREFYFKYTSDFISNVNPVFLTIVAVAINFLLITRGSCVLRYNT